MITHFIVSSCHLVNPLSLVYWIALSPDNLFVGRSSNRAIEIIYPGYYDNHNLL